MRQDIIFGSDSDEKKVLPGIIRATNEIEGLEVRVHYASADNTPKKVAKIMDELSSKEGKKVYISGAGMSNVLTGVVKTYANVNDLVIGIPIIDSSTKGLSSLLSTNEKPPRNPVLAVGLNNTYAALNIAERFKQGFGYGAKPVILEDKRDTAKLREAFDNLDLRYVLKSFEEIKPDDFVVNVFAPGTDSSLRKVDAILIKGKGIQVGVYSGELPMNNMEYNTIDYIYSLRDTEATGMVGLRRYENAAMVAAQLVQNENSLAEMAKQKKSKSEKLDAHPGLIVIDGEAKPYEVQ